MSNDGPVGLTGDTDRTGDQYVGPTTFSYDSYRRFLRFLVDEGYTFRGYGEPMTDGSVLLRHDVDWSPARALRMARLEADVGVTSTYLFLLTSPLYNAHSVDVRDVVATIVDLGHDVGLHFSTHQYWSAEPARDELTEAVARELSTLSTIVGRRVDTVSFHIPPSWVLGVDFDEFHSTYAGPVFEEITYRGDSNQRWRSDPPLVDGAPPRMQLLVHPGLWAETDETFERRLEREQTERFEAIRSFLAYQFLDDAVER